MNGCKCQYETITFHLLCDVWLLTPDSSMYNILVGQRAWAGLTLCDIFRGALAECFIHAP